MKHHQSNRLPHPTAEYFVASSARLNVTRLLALCAILLMSLLVCIPSSVYSHQPISSPPTPMQGHGAQRTALTARTLSPPALVSPSVSSSVGDVAVDVGGNTIKKLNGADGTVLWSAPISNEGTNEGVLAVDQLDLGVYTGNGSHIIGGTSTVYKYTSSGELAWTNTISRSGTCNFYRVTGAAVDTSSSSPGVVWTQSGCYGGIAKSDRTTGVQQWSVFTLDITRPTIDPSNGDIYAITTQSWNQIYKATTTGSLTSAASCNGQSDLNPADGMLYRGGGSCGLTLSQLNKSNLAVPNWSMSVPGITSFDSIAVQPWSGGYIYVASMSSSKIVVVNPSTQTVVTSFTTAVPPSNIAVNPSVGNLYITNGASNFVYAYSPTGSLVWTSPDLGGPVYNVAAPMGIVGTASTLGNYPDTTVALGANATVTPDAAPTNATSINVASSTNFKGTLSADPATGVVRVTNAHPAGNHTVTVRAFNGSVLNTTKTFTLTVNNAMQCVNATFGGASGSPFAAGSQPYSVAVGDFNGDGRQDLATAKYGSSSNNVTVLLGDGSGGFSPASGSPFAVGSYPLSVVVGDFNGDGKQDLTTANNRSDSVTVLLGDGSGGFSPASASPFAIGHGPYSLAVGDFNGDGRQDLTTANAGAASVTLLLGNGSGGFSPATGSPFAVGLDPQSVAVGDFNGDGKLDLTTANYLSNNVTVLLGNGSGGFSAATGSPFAVGSGPRSVAVGDFNGDGKLDLTTANQSSPSTVTVLLGSGGGGFSPATGSPFALGGTSPYSVAVGDLNRDGKLDIMTANVDSNNVTALLGDGSGGFSPASNSPFTVGTHPFSFTVGDFNGDGKLDLTTANYNSNNVTVLLGDGSGGFSAATGSPFAFGLHPLSPAVGDFNSDGKLDLAIANEPSSNVTVLLNTCSQNTAPTINAVGVTRQQGSPSANSTIANVNDLEDVETALIMTVNGGASATVNGVTVSGLSVSSAGVVTANVVASCTATTATFTLRVNDTGALFNEATLTVTVNPNAAPTLTYSSPQSVIFGGALNVTPTAASDNGAVTYSVQAGHGLTPPPTVDASGVVSTITAQPSGAHTITIRATDNCGLFTDAVFTLNVGDMPTFTIDDVTHSEGDVGTLSYTFTVTKTGSTALNSAVNFATVDGTATTAGNDYQFNSGALNFLPADTTKQITVLVICDTAVEPDEAFSVHLSGASAAAISDADGTAAIINDDCDVLISNDSEHFTAAGGARSVTLTTSSACTWTAVSNDPSFITVTSGSSGAGNGTVTYSVAANIGPARTGTMTIAGHTFTVTQDSGCVYQLGSMNQNFVAAGGTNSVNVITVTGCPWTAVSNHAWIIVDTGTPGSGNGTVGYSVAANIGPARTGTMMIAGITFTVTQDSGCTFTLSRDHQSFAGNGGNGAVNVTASDPACAWTASTTSTFVHITSGSSGIGNGAVQYSVDVNPGPTIRNDTITVGGHTYTVYQGINFLDVPPTAVFYNEIGKLSARGVTLGCGSGNYCPNDQVLRDQMAAFIMRAKGEFNPPMPLTQRFADVPPENAFYRFIDRLAELQITLGCSPSMYCPSDAVKREQMAAFIIRGLGEFNPPIPDTQRFDDVPPGNPFYKFIDRMAVLQITLGCAPAMYCPSDTVTRAQMAAFLVRAFDL